MKCVQQRQGGGRSRRRTSGAERRGERRSDRIGAVRIGLDWIDQMMRRDAPEIRNKNIEFRRDMSHSSDRSLRRTALHCAARFDSTRLDATHFETRDAESLYQHGAPRVFCALNTRCQYLQRVAPCHFYSHCTLLYCTVYYYILYTVYCTVLYTRSSVHYRSVQSRGAATSRRSCRVSSSRVPALRFPTEGGGRSTRCHPSVIRRRSWRPSQALAERPPLRARAALHEQSRAEASAPLCAAPRCSAQQLWRSHLKTAVHFTGAPSVRNGRTIETAGEPREERRPAEECGAEAGATSD